MCVAWFPLCAAARAQAGVGVDWVHYRDSSCLTNRLGQGRRVTLSGDRQQQQLEVVV